MRLRRLIPPRQESRCDRCGQFIVERRRRPCSACGSINRIVSRGWTEAAISHDEVGIQR